jgi:hypothetical protein
MQLNGEAGKREDLYGILKLRWSSCTLKPMQARLFFIRLIQR